MKPSAENARRMVARFVRVRLPGADQIEDILSHPGKMLQLGIPPNRIDVLTSVSGVEFEDLWRHSIPGHLDGLAVLFPDLDSLLRNKRASGRPKDLADVDELEKVANSRHANDA